MKSLAQILFLLLCLTGIVFAQDGNSMTDWVSLERGEDEFALQVPKGFTYLKDPFENKKYEARGEFQSDAERFYIFVDIVKRNDSQRKYVEAFLRSVNQTTSVFEFSGLQASKTEFKDPTGFYHRVFFVMTPTRTFSLHTVSRHENTEDAIRFLNSFRLISNGGVTPAPAVSIFSLKPKIVPEISRVDVTPKVTGGGFGSASGSGSGSGNGNGAGSGSSVTSASQRKIQPLKITYRHKAEYTDFARFYMIKGTVTLRVTFLASGRIGSIVKVKSLPFGLTESAIEAAALMRFEVEKANDDPRSTTRPVVYTFNIY